MKILITGGAGYIGSHSILDILETTGWEVISADNFLRSSPAAFERIRKITGKSIRNYAVDLCDLPKTRKIFSENPDIGGVIHFAALKSVPESVQHPDLYDRNNMVSLQNILICLREFHISNFIFSSSCSVYGDIDQLPVNEKTPVGKAQSPYGLTKQKGEELIRNFCKENPDIRCIALRYFNPAGAHESGLNGEVPMSDHPSLVPSITQKASGKRPSLKVFGTDYPTRDGSCIRDYVHVMDIAHAHVLALNLLSRPGSGLHFEIINLGTGQGVSVLEAIRAFEKTSGEKLAYDISPRRDGDVVAIYSDCSKAEKLLGWKPRYSIEDIMRTAWKWENTNTQ